MVKMGHDEPRCTCTGRQIHRAKGWMTSVLVLLIGISRGGVEGAPSASRVAKIDRVGKIQISKPKLKISNRTAMDETPYSASMGTLSFRGGQQSAVIRTDNSVSTLRQTSSAAAEGFKNSIASGLAAACSKTLLAPFDTIKTMQQQVRSGTNVGSAVSVASGKSLTLLEAARLIMDRPKGFLELYVSSLPANRAFIHWFSFAWLFQNNVRNR